MENIRIIYRLYMDIRIELFIISMGHEDFV